MYKLLCSGDVETNPGYESSENSSLPSSTQGQTRKCKHPCKMCSKPVRCNQKGILCDSCESWFHCRCIQYIGSETKTVIPHSGNEE